MYPAGFVLLYGVKPSAAWYCGMFMTFPPYVAGPLVPVVVRVNAGAAPRFASAPAAVVAPVPPAVIGTVVSPLTAVPLAG